MATAASHDAGDGELALDYGLKNISDDYVFSSSSSNCEEKSLDIQQQQITTIDSTTRSLEQVLETMDKRTEKSVRFNKEPEDSTFLWKLSQYFYYFAQWTISFVDVSENLFVLSNFSAPYLPYQVFIAFIYFDLMDRLFFMMGHRRPQLSHPARIVFKIIQLLVYTNFCNFSSSSIIFYVVLFAFKANLVVQEYYHVVQEALAKFNDQVEKKSKISDDEFGHRYLQAIMVFASIIVIQVSGFVYVFADDSSFFVTFPFEVILTFYFWTTVSIGSFLQKKILYPISFVNNNTISEEEIENASKMDLLKQTYSLLLRLRNTYFDIYLAVIYNAMFVILCFAFSITDRLRGQYTGTDWPLWYSLSLLILMVLGSMVYLIRTREPRDAVGKVVVAESKRFGILDWTKQSENQEWVAEDNLKF